jgi:hypothetical protein
VRNDSIAGVINKTIGERVALTYEQHQGVPTSCFAETEYYVVGVTPVGGQATPVAPAPPAPPATPATPATPGAPAAAPAPAAPATPAPVPTPNPAPAAPPPAAR